MCIDARAITLVIAMKFNTRACREYEEEYIVLEGPGTSCLSPSASLFHRVSGEADSSIS